MRTTNGTMYVTVNTLKLVAPNEAMECEELLKEWVWQNCKENILDAMTIEHEPIRKKQEIATRRLSLLDKIARVQQRQYLVMEEPKEVFGYLLNGILDLLDSEYGFIGEVKTDENGATFLQTHAITKIAWNEETRTFYEENIDSGLKFYNMNSLFGHVIVNGEPVISNTPANDNRGCGVPEGHPPLNHFLGFPFFEKGGAKVSGMVGISNKPGGYSQADIDILEPFGLTCSNLIQAYGTIRQNKELIDTLEEKVADRTTELRFANRQLEEANQRVVEASAAQLEHFACMSHEIRTPLNCVIGLSSLLQETSLTPKQQDSLQMIVTSGQLLLTVVNDVLDYSKLVSGKVDFDIRKTSLQETLDAVVHSIELRGKNRNISLQTYYDARVPEYIETDSRRLQQILFNILGNAIKFSRDGGTVEFSVYLIDKGEPLNENESDALNEMLTAEQTKKCPQSGNTSSNTSRCPFHRSEWKSPPVCQAEKQGRERRMLRFVVKDYGKGIEKQNFEKIFQPFLQASRETERLYGGTGLGLAITSKLVAGLGGTISVDSVLGEWSEFTFEFPLGEYVADVDKISNAIRNARVLLVNDDERQNPSPESLELYNVNVAKINSCQDLEILLPVKGTVDLSGFHICLIREDLYVRDVYERFASAAPHSVLLTFGPEYKVRESKMHYRSLVRVLPSVLMRSLASQVPSSSDETAHCIQRDITPAKRKRAPLQEVRVLIVEDNVINQKVLRRMLVRLGLDHVDIVDNGQKAVDKTSCKSYDLVFMDMQMPVMDGFEATRLIIERDGQNGPVIVFVTANASESFEEKARKSGAKAFISKPFTLRDIERILQSPVRAVDKQT